MLGLWQLFKMFLLLLWVFITCSSPIQHLLASAGACTEPFGFTDVELSCAAGYSCGAYYLLLYLAFFKRIHFRSGEVKLFPARTETKASKDPWSERKRRETENANQISNVQLEFWINKMSRSLLLMDLSQDGSNEADVWVSIQKSPWLTSSMAFQSCSSPMCGVSLVLPQYCIFFPISPAGQEIGRTH